MKCVVKFEDGYLKGKDTYNLGLVTDLWKARIYSNTGAAKNSINALYHYFENKNWGEPKVVEVEIYEKGSIENFIGENYFGSENG